jgi:hypothetical protein
MYNIEKDYNMFNEYNFNREIVEYWKHFGLTEKDFYCRECGKLMLDFSTINNLQFKPKLYNGEITSKSVVKYKTTYPYVDSEHNRWLVTGKTLSGKTYFRHLCWDCFFKHLSEIEDIPKRARKSSWYKDILAGNFRPPAKCSSPSKYFKILFDITDEELEKEHKKFDTASLESFIRRHGEKEGPRKYEEYKNRQAYTCSKEYMMNEKGMTEQEWNEFNANRACTKKNFIKRYGKELGQEKWNKYCELESYAGNKLEYFIEKYGNEEGTKKYIDVCRQKVLSKDNFIRKYGVEEGQLRWNKYLENNKVGYSIISQELFKLIDAKYNLAKLNSRYASKNGEMCIELPFDNNTKCFMLDFVLFNKVIEFNGDYYHANPHLYKSDDFIQKYSNGKYAKEIWNYDEKRLTAIKNAGYEVKVIWESDYYTNPEKILEECVEFLTRK